MADLHKRLEKAEKYLQKGKQSDALEEYLAILEEEPNQDNVREQAADLCIALGRQSDAAILFSELFNRYADIGDQSRAIIIYKKLHRQGTPTVDQSFRYAQFLEKPDVKAALEVYEQVAETYEKSGRPKDALTCRKRIVLLNPSTENHQRLGGLAATQGDHGAAAVSFMTLAELEPQRALFWLERAYTLAKNNPAVVLAFGSELLALQQFERAIEALRPLALATDSSAESREAFARSLLGAKRPLEAEPLVWDLFQQNSSLTEELTTLLDLFLEQGDQNSALALARKTEEWMMKKNLRREFVAILKDATCKHVPGVEFLEYLVEVYNSANREDDYCETLVSLFQLYFAANNYVKAADALDRAAEVDPYEAEHRKCLERLRGKIDQNRYNAIAHRFQIAGTVSEEIAEDEQREFDSEPTVLEDFMLQAEIFLQYGMRAKAVERLQRINRFFPHEEEKNEKLRNLFVATNYAPKYRNQPAPADVDSSPAPARSGRAARQEPGTAPSTPDADHEIAVDNFASVTEISRNIYRQASVKGVLFTAVNDVGRHFRASRCVAGLCVPGKPPTAAMEYCASGIKQSDVRHIVKLLQAVQALAMKNHALSFDRALGALELAAVEESITVLGIQSLLAVPLLGSGNEGHVGVLLLEQCGKARKWRPTDTVVLKTIADQIVLAVNNAKLRSLMKNLAVTDEKSGLLKRSSYLDVLLSEAKRALAQNSTTSLILLNFGKASAMVKEVGEAPVESMMQRIGQTICSQLRQNDLAVRYELTTIGLVLPDTNEKNCFLVVDKLRKALAGFMIAETGRHVKITAGIAEAMMNQLYDPVDIVTEVINRAEAALEAAKVEGHGAVIALSPQLEPGAVV